MPRVGIVTDSTNCLPAELIKEYDIRVIPCNLAIDGKAYLDQVDITPDEFWRLFKEAKTMPTTGAVSPGAFISAFTELGKSTDSIVCLLLPKVLSAVNEIAVQASQTVKAEHPNLNIEIIDSKTSGGAMGFIVLEAARAAGVGKNLDEVVQVAQEMIPRVKLILTMDTLKYLIKIGRAPKTAYLGELLQVKPIVGMVNGTGFVDLLGRVRGKRKAMLKLVDMVKEYIDTSKPLHIMVHYTDSMEVGKELRDMVTSRYNCAELYFTPYTPVMACATGPVLSLSFYS